MQNLGSTIFSLNRIPDSIKSELTYCLSSFARALVIGPILILLDLFFAATSSSSLGVGDNGSVLGMLMASPLFFKYHSLRLQA
jgi:hypothetical protein